MHKHCVVLLVLDAFLPVLDPESKVLHESTEHMSQRVVGRVNPQPLPNSDVTQYHFATNVMIHDYIFG